MLEALMIPGFSPSQPWSRSWRNVLILKILWFYSETRAMHVLRYYIFCWTPLLWLSWVMNHLPNLWPKFSTRPRIGMQFWGTLASVSMLRNRCAIFAIAPNTVASNTCLHEPQNYWTACLIHHLIILKIMCDNHVFPSTFLSRLECTKTGFFTGSPHTHSTWPGGWWSPKEVQCRTQTHPDCHRALLWDGQKAFPSAFATAPLPKACQRSKHHR